MKRWLSLGLAVVVVGLAMGLSCPIASADDKAGVSGNWKVTTTLPNGQTRESTLKLKQEGDKVTGVSVGGPQNVESKVDEGKFKDGELTFTVTREREGQKFTVKYKAKVTGDTMKGKAEIDIGGETRTMDWDAKREK